MGSPPGPLNPFPFLDISVSSADISGNTLFRITFSAAPKSTTTVIVFHTPGLPAGVSLHQVVQRPRRLPLLRLQGCERLALYPLAFSTLILFRFGPPFSLIRCSTLASFSGFSSSSLSHVEPWSPSSSMLLVHLHGTIHTDVPLLSALVATSSIALTFTVVLCLRFYCTLCLDTSTNQVRFPGSLFLTSFPFLRRLCCHSPFHQLLFLGVTLLLPFGPFLPAPFASFASLPRDRTHIVARHVVARVLITLRRSRIVRADNPQIRWYWSVVGNDFDYDG